MKKLLSFLLLNGAMAAVAQQQQPNIVMLFVDDLGWADLGYNNPKLHTPNIDRLQEEGLYFSRTYVSTATSSPSRASILTGKEALRCGFVRHIEGDKSRKEFQTWPTDPGHMLTRAWLPLEEITYAERLKDYGYYNYFVGKWHLGFEKYYPIYQGFDEMFGTCEHGHPKGYYPPFFKTENPFPDANADDYLTDMLTDGAERFIATYDKDQPFLLNFWYYTVHSPHRGRKDLVEMYKKEGLTGKYAEYAAMVSALDESVGRIRKAIEDKGIADNTVIIFASDQGGAFQNGPLSGGKLGGNTLGEGGSRVPMIIYAPHMKSMGQTYDKPVQTIDIYPTMVELASGKKCKDGQINGVSLLPILDGKDIKKRDLFMHRSYEDQNSAIIRGDWKLIKHRSGKVLLFNIKDDLGETHNLVDEYPKLAKRLLKRLNDWQEEATPKELLQDVE